MIGASADFDSLGALSVLTGAAVLAASSTFVAASSWAGAASFAGVSDFAGVSVFAAAGAVVLASCAKLNELSTVQLVTAMSSAASKVRPRRGPNTNGVMVVRGMA